MDDTESMIEWVELGALEALKRELTQQLSIRRGLVISASAQAELIQALTSLRAEELVCPVALELSNLEALSALSHLQLTQRGPLITLPEGSLRAARLTLQLNEEPSAVEGLLASTLYQLLAIMPEGEPERATWVTHADGALDLSVTGRSWSLRLSVLRPLEPLAQGEVGLMSLSGTRLAQGDAVRSTARLLPPVTLEKLTLWSEEGRARWRVALQLLIRARGAGVATRSVGAQIHERAQLHPSVELAGPVQVGAGTKVWHFSKLLGPLEIGEDCNLGQNVVVERHASLGRNVKVQNNVSIYSGVVLEDDVFCGPSMVFTNVGTPRSHYPRRGAYQETRVKRGASIGANATVVCGSTIGRYALVGAGAVVTKDVPDYALAFGNPARVQGWVCYCGEGLSLGRGSEASVGQAEASCGECGRSYGRDGLRVTERR